MLANNYNTLKFRFCDLGLVCDDTLGVGGVGPVGLVLPPLLLLLLPLPPYFHLEPFSPLERVLSVRCELYATPALPQPLAPPVTDALGLALVLAAQSDPEQVLEFMAVV